jgi:hypothetical protein
MMMVFDSMLVFARQHGAANFSLALARARSCRLILNRDNILILSRPAPTRQSTTASTTSAYNDASTTLVSFSLRSAPSSSRLALRFGRSFCALVRSLKFTQKAPASHQDHSAEHAELPSGPIKTNMRTAASMMMMMMMMSEDREHTDAILFS